MRRDPLACRKIAIFGISAGIAQLVERHLPKVDVGGPNPLSRFKLAYMRRITRAWPVECA